jgi:hypothetical protein
MTRMDDGPVSPAIERQLAANVVRQHDEQRPCWHCTGTGCMVKEWADEVLAMPTERPI